MSSRPARSLSSAYALPSVEPISVSDAVVPRTKFKKLWAIVDKLDAYGVEAQGIERVSPDARPQKCAFCSPHSLSSLLTCITSSCSGAVLAMARR